MIEVERQENGTHDMIANDTEPEQLQKELRQYRNQWW